MGGPVGIRGHQGLDGKHFSKRTGHLRHRERGPRTDSLEVDPGASPCCAIGWGHPAGLGEPPGPPQSQAAILASLPPLSCDGDSSSDRERWSGR